jgi:hypothetical protein
MLFFCKWAAATSLLVDDVDEAHAREVATDVAGEPPASMIPLEPRAFVAEVYPDEDEAFMVVEPLEHVDDLLGILDGDGEEDHFADGEEEEDEEGEECGHEAEGEGGDVFVCTLPRGHGGIFHEARDERGSPIATWPLTETVVDQPGPQS